MDPIPLKSGHSFVFGLPDFGPSSKLKRLIAAELLKVQIEGMKVDLETILKQDVSKVDPATLNTVKNLLMQVVASDTIEAAIFECAAKSTIDGQRIVKDTFQPHDMRQDFFPVAWEVMRGTLGPFFGNVDWSSFIRSGQPASDPQSPSG